MVGIVTVALVFLPFLPSRARQWAVLGFVAAGLALFVAVPGLVATLFGTATAGTADPSITARLQDYPRVEAMVAARPVDRHRAGRVPVTLTPSRFSTTNT